jgi:GNAT superfamily N-acetyltransferase
MAEIRPMREADVEAVTELAFAAGDDLDRRMGLPVEARPDLSMVHRRYAHPLRTDPDGAWVAEDEQGLAACALSFRREDLWILTEISVRPDLQSAGLGRAILARCHEYADGAKGRLITTSRDPRALRAYVRLGLDLHPCFRVHGAPQHVTEPPGIREGDASDLPFTEAVDRHVRGAAHGPDIQVLLDSDQTLLVSDRGYAVVSETGSVRLLAALDEAAARDLLNAVLARAGDRAIGINWITGRQQWAIQACVEARLELRTDTGALFAGGDVGPFHPYLPSGAYL